MNSDGIPNYWQSRGVTRLVHFTRTVNVGPIIRDGAIRSISDLAQLPFTTHSPADLARSDGHPDKLSLSFQYPNAYFLDKARRRDVNFTDWACFLIDPAILDRGGALFAPYNAGTYGVPLRPGLEGLRRCYADVVAGPNRTVRRGARHNQACATDIQAEVLMPGPINLSDVLSIVTATEVGVDLERGRIRLQGIEPGVLRWQYSPEMFEIAPVVRAVQQGAEIPICDWEGREDA